MDLSGWPNSVLETKYGICEDRFESWMSLDLYVFGCLLSWDSLSRLDVSLDRRGALSLLPNGRPVFLRGFGCRLKSRGKVSSHQVRPFQISRIVFSLTPKALATDVAVGLDPLGKQLVERQKISMACCLVSTARGLAHETSDGISECPLIDVRILKPHALQYMFVMESLRGCKHLSVYNLNTEVYKIYSEVQQNT